MEYEYTTLEDLVRIIILNMFIINEIIMIY